MTYRVSGEAHGTSFDESGFTTDVEAMAYASSIIDGDVDSTVEITSERADHDHECRDCGRSIPCNGDPIGFGEECWEGGNVGCACGEATR